MLQIDSSKNANFRAQGAECGFDCWGRIVKNTTDWRVDAESWLYNREKLENQKCWRGAL
jgi:hypothetical protein